MIHVYIDALYVYILIVGLYVLPIIPHLVLSATCANKSITCQLSRIPPGLSASDMVIITT